MLKENSSELAVYIISKHSYNHRAKILLNLNNYFNKMTFITCDGDELNSNHDVVGFIPNPTGILRIIGQHKLKRLMDKFLFFPSIHILCVKSALKKIQLHIKNDLRQGLRICVITCLPPHDLAIIGLKLKKQNPEISWLVDWQDLWSFDASYFNRTPSIYRKKLLNLELEVLQNCDLNITTNPKAAEVLKNHYGIQAKNIDYIYHPYNSEDLSIFTNNNSLHEKHDSDLIKIGFLGNLNKPPKVPGIRVLKAIEDVIKSGKNIEFNIYGDETIITKQALDNLNCDRIYSHNSTTHLKSLKNISKCDFLLIALADLPNCNVIMHGKLPHYLILNKPILAFVPNNSFVADVIRKTGSGIVISTDKEWGIELNNIIQMHIDGKLHFIPNEEEIKKFSWEAISKKWLNVISNNY